MCESDVFLGNDKIMHNIVTLFFRNGKVVLVDFKGKEKEMEKKIDHIDFIKHRVVLK